MEVRGTLYILKDIREYGVKANGQRPCDADTATTPSAAAASSAIQQPAVSDRAALAAAARTPQQMPGQ